MTMYCNKALQMDPLASHLVNPVTDVLIVFEDKEMMSTKSNVSALLLLFALYALTKSTLTSQSSFTEKACVYITI